jgi:hypothetical protein
VFFASGGEIRFDIPRYMLATASDQQEGDPYWVYNHFQQWELKDWPATILTGDNQGKTKSPSPLPKVKGAVVTLKRAGVFAQQQMLIKAAYWKTMSGYVAPEIWGLAEA